MLPICFMKIGEIFIMIRPTRGQAGFKGLMVILEDGCVSKQWSFLKWGIIHEKG